MTVQVRQQNQAPILLVTFENELSLGTVFEMYYRSAELADKIESPVIHRVINFKGIKTNFLHIVNVARSLDPEEPGCLSDPRFRNMFVGRQPIIRQASELFAQKLFGGLYIPVFEELDAALDYVQHEVGGAV